MCGKKPSAVVSINTRSPSRQQSIRKIVRVVDVVRSRPRSVPQNAAKS
jgi:hypothetical protein